MEKSFDATGKTIDEAVDNALKELGLDRDSVSVEILEKPKAGFLGIGSAPARVRVHYIVEQTDRVKDFLEGLFKHMNIAAETAIDTTTSPGVVDIKVTGENVGALIGRRGETMDALQYITGLVVNRGEEEYRKVSIDIENYRAKRTEALEKLANKLAGMVVRNKKSITLEAMNSHERRIIHSSLQNYPGVTTFSVGTEPNRRVVIATADRRRPDPKRDSAPQRDRAKD